MTRIMTATEVKAKILIYATAVEHGWRLVTKDQRMRDHPYPRNVTLW